MVSDNRARSTLKSWIYVKSRDSASGPILSCRPIFIYLFIGREMVLIVHGFPNKISALRASLISCDFDVCLFYSQLFFTVQLAHLSSFGFPWSLSRDLSHLWLEPWLVSINLVLWLVFLIWKDLWLFCSHLPLWLFQFEWAWQNPDRSRRLRDLHPKTKKESAFQFKFRIVSKMLRTAPWCRLPLTIRWLKQDYQQDFPVNANPPTHMPIVYGPVSVKTVKPGPLETQSQNGPEDPDDVPAFTQRSWTRCAVCCQKMTVSGMHLFQLLAECMATMLILMFQGEMVKISCSFFAKQIVEENTLRCLKPACRMVSHTLCLARHFLGADSTEVLPTEGQCPSCRSVLLWGDLIRFKAGLLPKHGTGLCSSQGCYLCPLFVGCCFLLISTRIHSLFLSKHLSLTDSRVNPSMMGFWKGILSSGHFLKYLVRSIPRRKQMV